MAANTPVFQVGDIVQFARHVRALPGSVLPDYGSVVSTSFTITYGTLMVRVAWVRNGLRDWLAMSYPSDMLELSALSLVPGIGDTDAVPKG